jgi:hypothetical protein
MNRERGKSRFVRDRDYANVMGRESLSKEDDGIRTIWSPKNIFDVTVCGTL